MRVYNNQAQAHREEYGGLIEIPMVLISAINRETLVSEYLGMWLGKRTEIIQVLDLFTHVISNHTFYVGGLLELPSVQYESGLNVRPLNIRLSAIDDSVLAAFRLYNARGAKIQGWRRTYDNSWNPISIEPWFKGYINNLSVTHPSVGGEASIDAEIVSTAMMLTVSSDLTASDAFYKTRGDAIMKYADNTGTWDVPWGVQDDKDHPEDSSQA